MVTNSALSSIDEGEFTAVNRMENSRFCQPLVGETDIRDHLLFQIRAPFATGGLEDLDYLWPTDFDSLIVDFDLQ